MTRRDLAAALACYWIVFIAIPGALFLAAALRGWRP